MRILLGAIVGASLAVLAAWRMSGPRWRDGYQRGWEDGGRNTSYAYRVMGR